MKPRALALLISLGLTVACNDDKDPSESDTNAATSSPSTTAEPVTTGASNPTEASESLGDTGAGETDDTTNTADDTTGEPADPWQAFLDGREDALRTLAEPLLACIADVDNDYAVFSGCTDWGHAVQAAYALHVVSRLTGDPSYMEAAEAKFTADGLEEEAINQSEDTLIDVNSPFTHGWLLALAIEREKAGKMDLRPVAEAAVDSVLIDFDLYYDQDLLRYDVLKGDEKNRAWMFLSLWQWAQWTDDTELAAQMKDLSRDWLLEGLFGQDCPWSEDVEDIYEDLSACLFGTLVILTIHADQGDSWLDYWLPSTPIMPPAADEDTYVATLNFTRAWGLWKIHEFVDTPEMRDLFLDHFNTGMTDQWQPWVSPQAGIHAIALTYE